MRGRVDGKALGIGAMEDVERSVGTIEKSPMASIVFIGVLPNELCLRLRSRFVTGFTAAWGVEE